MESMESMEYKLPKVTAGSAILSNFHVNLTGGRINVRNFYYCCCVDYIGPPESYSRLYNHGRKVKVPPGPNRIYTVTYHDKKRGCIPKKKFRYLKNGMGMCITSKKEGQRIHARIYANNIGVSGADDDDEVKEVISYIFGRLQLIQRILNRIKRSKKLEATLKWIEEVTRGSEVTVLSGTEILAPQNNSDPYLATQKRRKLIVPEAYFDDTYPKHVDRLIAWFLLNKIFDFRFHSNYVNVIHRLVQIDHVLTGSISYKHVLISLLFMNFYTDFQVDLDKLYTLDRRYTSDFVLVQHDDNTSKVRMEIKYDIPPKLVDKVKISPGNAQIATVEFYRTGKRVTLSGPYPEINRRIYLKLLSFIHSVRSKIELK